MLQDVLVPLLQYSLLTIELQIRTRAVTLQKYISTSEDILKHASKLLKAELPVSLRLIGEVHDACMHKFISNPIEYVNGHGMQY